MVKKIKSTGLPSPTKFEFNKDENHEAAEYFWAEFVKLHEDDETLTELLKFAEWCKVAVGWRSFGRVITTGRCER